MGVVLEGLKYFELNHYHWPPCPGSRAAPAWSPSVREIGATRASNGQNLSVFFPCVGAQN
jgi:hypothetical protein